MAKYFVRERVNYTQIYIFEGNITNKYLYVFLITAINSIDGQPDEIKKVYHKKIENTEEAIMETLIYAKAYKEMTKNEVKEVLNKFIEKIF